MNVKFHRVVKKPILIFLFQIASAQTNPTRWTPLEQARYSPQITAFHSYTQPPPLQRMTGHTVTGRYDRKFGEGDSEEKCHSEPQLVGDGGQKAFRTRRESEEEEKESSCSYQGRLSRDERLVKEIRIPLTVEEIIVKPIEEFNDLLTSKDITEEQINICRDIMRRGKNKVRKI